MLINGNNSPEAILALEGTDEMLSSNRKWATVSWIPEQSGETWRMPRIKKLQLQCSLRGEIKLEKCRLLI